MKTILAAAMAVCVTAAAFAETAVEKVKWVSDYKAAVQQSEKTKKPIFIVFEGSDWCGWCKKLNAEILSNKQFSDWVNVRFIPYKADFPRSIKLDAAVKAQNEALQTKYGVTGYPTIVIVNAAGKKLATAGYMKTGPVALIRDIEGKLRK